MKNAYPKNRMSISKMIFNVIHDAQIENADRDFPRTRASLQATRAIVKVIQNNYRRRRK